MKVSLRPSDVEEIVDVIIPDPSQVRRGDHLASRGGQEEQLLEVIQGSRRRAQKRLDAAARGAERARSRGARQSDVRIRPELGEARKEIRGSRGDARPRRFSSVSLSAADACSRSITASRSADRASENATIATNPTVRSDTVRNEPTRRAMRLRFGERLARFMCFRAPAARD